MDTFTVKPTLRMQLILIVNFILEQEQLIDHDLV